MTTREIILLLGLAAITVAAGAASVVTQSGAQTILMGIVSYVSGRLVPDLQRRIPSSSEEIKPAVEGEKKP